MKGYKVWNPLINKTMCSREVERTSRNGDESKEEGPWKMEFELNNEGSVSNKKE